MWYSVQILTWLLTISTGRLLALIITIMWNLLLAIILYWQLLQWLSKAATLLCWKLWLLLLPRVWRLWLAWLLTSTSFKYQITDN